MWFANGFVHGGSLTSCLPPPIDDHAGDVVRGAGGGRTSTEVLRPFICDKLQMKCNPPTIGP